MVKSVHDGGCAGVVNVVLATNTLAGTSLAWCGDVSDAFVAVLDTPRKAMLE